MIEAFVLGALFVLFVLGLIAFCWIMWDEE